MDRAITRRTSEGRIAMGLVVFVSGALACGIAHAEKLRNMPNPIQGEYIVVLVEPAAAPDATDVATSDDGAVRAGFLAVGSALVQTYGGTVVTTWQDVLLALHARMSEMAAKAVAADPRVAYVEQNAVVTGRTTETLPGDGSLWGLDRIDERTRVLDHSYTYNVTGAGAHVYVLDSAILKTHSEFQNPNRVSDGRDSYTIVNMAPEYDCVTHTLCNEFTPCQCCTHVVPPEPHFYNHGTLVASVIGGNTLGVAKGVTIHPVRVLNKCGDGTTATFVDGMNWVAGNHISPAIANMSIGISPSDCVDQAVSNLLTYGVLPIAAPPDSGDSCLESPARSTAAVRIGGTDPTDTNQFSIGSCIDLFAPGQAIRVASDDGGYIQASGTSPAAAFASGVAALFYGEQQYVNPRTVGSFLGKNATTNVVINPGGAPNRLLYSRWNQSWYWSNTEHCEGSCYNTYWWPACPPRPVWMKACSVPGDDCWSIVNSSYVEEYECSGSN
ncbi:MAG TPA: S8 family serine peptidase [Vicinamibacterales bacterium]|nr:S8 family serine peptidase [Vicinamibacterales bacterium]